ncbi:MAG: zinc ribbon domain-containing protein [Candidatus Riflebacteria bacterium]
MRLRTILSVIFFLTMIAIPAWALYCPACGTAIGSEDVFCRQCGKKLEPAQNSEIGPSTVAPLQKTVVVPSRSPQAFQVTSHYLNVGGNRLYRDSYYWIAEVAGEQARVWSNQGPPYDSLIMGWVSLSELEKRSTLTPGTVIVCAEPPPPNPTRVIVIERINFWHHWGPGNYNHSRSHRSHHFRRFGCP